MIIHLKHNYFTWPLNLLCWWSEKFSFASDFFVTLQLWLVWCLCSHVNGWLNGQRNAVYALQAMMGRWMPLAVVYHKDYQSAKRAFLLYHQLFLARGIIYFVMMILPFFEVSHTTSWWHFNFIVEQLCITDSQPERLCWMKWLEQSRAWGMGNFLVLIYL